jgi:hypothetical protein
MSALSLLGDLSLVCMFVFMFTFTRPPPSPSLRRAVSDITLVDHSFCIFLFCILSSTVLLTFSIFFKCLKNIQVDLSVVTVLETVEAEVMLVLVESGLAAPALPCLLRYLRREDVCVLPSELPPILPAVETHVWRMSLDCCVERDKGSFGLS